MPRSGGPRGPAHPHGRVGRHRVRDGRAGACRGPGPRCHRHHGPRTHRCGRGRAGDRPGPGPARRGHRRRGGDDARRPPAGAGPPRAGQVVPVMRTTIAEIHDQGALAIPAHPLVPYPLCAQARTLAACSTRSGRPAGRPRDVQPDIARPAAPPDGRPLRGRPRPRPGRQQRRPCPRRRGDRLDLVPGPHGGGPAAAIAAGTTRHHGTFHETLGQLGTFRDQLRKRGRDARDEPSAGSARTGPGATTAIPAVGSGHRATSAAIGARP